MGKQRAARSAVPWDARDIQHPLLGPIRFAAPRTATATAIPGGKILSTVYVSCQKDTGKVAIELSNAPDSDPAGGLRPTEAPRLVCGSPGRSAGSLVKKEIAVKWEVRPLGDALARGIAPSELRRCVSIDVQQRVALSGSSSQKTQRIAMEIAPYDRALDSVFAACGEPSAYAEQGSASRVPPAPVAPPVARQEPPPQPGPVAQSAPGPWKPARTTTKGRTNLRAATSVDSAIVAKLAPGTAVLARQTTPSWWEVRPRKGQGFRGYVREDRLAFE